MLQGWWWSGEWGTECWRWPGAARGGPLAIFTRNNLRPSLPQAALNWGNKKDEPVFVTEESGVVGLNFHQSKEMLINESNGHLDVCNPENSLVKKTQILTPEDSD